MNEKNKQFSTRHSSLSIRTPAIRFKGFGGEWEEEKLGEVYDFQYGQFNVNPSDGGKHPVYGANGIIGGYSNFNAEDSVVIGHMGEYAGSVLWGEGKHFVTYNGTISKPKSTNINPKYGYYILCKLDIRKICGGSGQPFLSYETLQKLVGVFPISTTEQTKIGSYFQQLDTLITQHQRKHDKLLNVKKAMLEKMFPKKGAEVPEIRFKGFSEKWEERKLNEIADRYDNLRVPITASSRVLGNTPYYGANGIQDYVEGYTHDGEFILIAEDGANDLKNYPVQYVNGKIWVNNHAHVLQSKRMVADNYFLKFTISQTNIEPFLVGGGRAKLNAETMMRIVIDIPLNTDEQTKIGKLFKNLDTLLSLHQTELEKLKNIKKACLEKMFV